MSTELYVSMVGAIAAVAYLALFLALRAIIMKQPPWLALVSAAVCSLVWPLALPRSGIDRIVRFWLSAVLFVGIAYMIRVVRGRRTQGT